MSGSNIDYEIAAPSMSLLKLEREREREALQRALTAMEAIFNSNQCLYTIGTSYYFSSYHYLGYSPYGGGGSGGVEDVKPDVFWVSARLIPF